MYCGVGRAWRGKVACIQGRWHISVGGWHRQGRGYLHWMRLGLTAGGRRMQQRGHEGRGSVGVWGTTLGARQTWWLGCEGRSGGGVRDTAVGNGKWWVAQRWRR